MARGPGEASACSARPPAVPAPTPQPALEAWGEWGGGHFPGPQLGAGGSWKVQAGFCLPIQHPTEKRQASPTLSLCPQHCAETWESTVLPRQGAVLPECGVAHTRAPACMLVMCVEPNTDTGTNISSLRNVHALRNSYLRQCARVQRNYTWVGANTKAGTCNMWASYPCMPVCTCYAPNIYQMYMHTPPFHTYPCNSVHPEMPVPCAYKQSQR